MMLVTSEALWLEATGRCRFVTEQRQTVTKVEPSHATVNAPFGFDDSPDDLCALSPCSKQARKSAKLTVGEILRRYWPDYLKNHRPTLTRHEIHVLTQLTMCRTPELGGTVWCCRDCGHEHIFYHSCGLRQCPTCGAQRRDQWLQRALAESLPVPYTHIVTTVPHEFSLLGLANRKPIYNLLLQATRKALLKLGKRLGLLVSGVLLLHTWGQLCLAHMHCHALLPAGGPSLDGTRWIRATDPNDMFCLETLMKTFRQFFCDGLERLYQRGQLILVGVPGEAALSLDGFRAWLRPLRERRWIVDQQGPPAKYRTSEAAIGYLARYMQGTAISNRRIVSDRGGMVTFKAKDYRNGGQRIHVAVSGAEFIERFLMHILPKGFHRVRHFGYLAKRDRKAALTHCRNLLGEHEAASGADEAQGFDGDSDTQPEIEFQGWCRNCRRFGTLTWCAEIPGTRGWQRYRSLVPNASKRRLTTCTQSKIFTSGSPP